MHKLLTAGTVEEKVDRLLETKRDLAVRIVGAGEGWITEMDDRALRELFTLSSDAVVGEEDAEEEQGTATPGRTVPRLKRRARSGGAPGARRGRRTQ